MVILVFTIMAKEYQFRSIKRKIYMSLNSYLATYLLAAITMMIKKK